MKMGLNEKTVEQAALDSLRELGYDTLFGQDIAPGEPAASLAAAQADCERGAGRGYAGVFSREWVLQALNPARM